MDRVRKKVGCDGFIAEQYGGRGVGIAVLDTGISPHIDLKGRVLTFVDMIGGSRTMYDDNGHGTHISGIICGSGADSLGKYRGIAPFAHLIVLKVLDQRGDGNTTDVLKGLDYVIRNKDRLGIRIVNISIGSIPKSNVKEKTRLIKGVEEAWDNGLCVVVAAGNDGPTPMSVTTPGISRKVITVGSGETGIPSGENGSRSFSGRGPTPYCIVKPEVIAPGVQIRSCAAAKDGYTVKSGSSMATAVASGCIALCMEKYPRLSNAEMKLRLYERCVRMDMPKNQQGWGMIHLHSLL